MRKITMAAIVASAMVTILLLSVTATKQNVTHEATRVPVCIEYTEQRFGANVQKYCRTQIWVENHE